MLEDRSFEVMLLMKTVFVIKQSGNDSLGQKIDGVGVLETKDLLLTTHVSHVRATL